MSIWNTWTSPRTSSHVLVCVCITHIYVRFDMYAHISIICTHFTHFENMHTFRRIAIDMDVSDNFQNESFSFKHTNAHISTYIHTHITHHTHTHNSYLHTQNSYLHTHRYKAASQHQITHINLRRQQHPLHWRTWNPFTPKHQTPLIPKHIHTWSAPHCDAV